MSFSPLASLTGSMFSTDAMQHVFSAQSSVQAMLDFEAALARAEAKQGVIPAQAAAPIEAQCDAALLDLRALAQAAGSAGNLAIPLVKQLTALVGKTDQEAAKYVHWGATSQDAIDTGLVLQLRKAFDLIEHDLQQLGDTLAELAQRHSATVMVGRTWMQHALPITFGLKVAGWLDGLNRHRVRFQDMRQRVLVLQFGGAAGTLASLGTHGMQVSNALAAELALAPADVPWHTQRDRMVEAASTLAMLTGSLGKMARDISLLVQTDVGEAAEPAGEGRGGSSTMPHKRNPVGCAATLTAAARVPGLLSTLYAGMVQEHERALGGWQAEWDTLPEIVQLTAGALRQMQIVVSGLEVHAQRMRENLDLTGGQIMAEAVTLALGADIGRMQAHKLVEAACRRASSSGRHLREVLAADPEIGTHLSPEKIDRLLDPSGYLGQAQAFVERVIRTHRGRTAEQD